MRDRTGIEEEAVVRLTSAIEHTSMRRIVIDCLTGSITPAAGLREMATRAEDISTIRSVIDCVTERAALISRSGDNLVRDRADDLTQLFVERAAECASADELLTRLAAS